jgi:hypothetical protein
MRASRHVRWLALRTSWSRLVVCPGRLSVRPGKAGVSRSSPNAVEIVSKGKRRRERLNCACAVCHADSLVEGCCGTVETMQHVRKRRSDQ